MTNETAIYIRPAPSGDGFNVTVEPAVSGFDFDRECPDYKFARTFARGIRVHRGFPINDLSGETAE